MLSIFSNIINSLTGSSPEEKKDNKQKIIEDNVQEKPINMELPKDGNIVNKIFEPSAEYIYPRCDYNTPFEYKTFFFTKKLIKE